MFLRAATKFTGRRRGGPEYCLVNLPSLLLLLLILLLVSLAASSSSSRSECARLQVYRQAGYSLALFNDSLAAPEWKILIRGFRHNFYVFICCLTAVGLINFLC